MKKHFLKSFALLAMLFSALTLSAQSSVDWSTISWIGSTDATYNEKFKCSTTEGLVNIQKPFGDEIGIYMTFPTDVDLTCNLSGFYKQGAGLLLYLSSFTAQETQVVATWNGGSRTFWVYYADGISGLLASDLTITAPTSETLTLSTGDTYTINHTTSSVGAITYESSNTSVAEVSNTGVITAKSVGTAIITVKQAASATHQTGTKKFNVEIVAVPIPSNNGFGTYQGRVDLYDWIGDYAGNNACGQVDLYVVTWGNDILFKAKAVEAKFDGAEYMAQLRTRNADLSDAIRESWGKAVADDGATRYSEYGNTYNNHSGLVGYGETFKMWSYMVIVGCGARTMKTLTYTRDHINNPIADNTTPTLSGAANVTSTAENITIALPTVTSEEVFYMIKDEAHNKQYISITPAFVLPKDGSGITYTYSCYAVDFNGNMSAPLTAEVSMPFNATSNLALNKPCQAGHSTNNDRLASKANDGDINSRWSSEQGNNPTDAWWYVDLGESYNLSTIEISWEGACATDYVIMGSDEYIDPTNATAWQTATTLVAKTTAPTVGNNTQEVYSVTGQHARYIRLQANTLANNGWGCSFYEFRVFGTGVYDPNAAADTEKPVITSATPKTPIAHNEVQITMVASDNVSIASYEVKDDAKGVSATCVPVDNVITVSNLQEQTTYNLSIVAVDAVGNKSDAYAMAAFTTSINPYIPHEAAPVPTRDAEDVIAFYSDNYAPVVNLWGKSQWNAVTLEPLQNASDNYLYYTGGNWWGWEFGVNAGANVEGISSGVDCSAMEYLHIDVWGFENGTIRILPIWGGTNLVENKALDTNDRYYALVEIRANQWNSVDIPLATGFQPEADKHDFSSIFQFKFADRTTTAVAIDNVYFWKSAGTAPVESVTLDKTTATIEVDEALQLKATVLPAEAANKNVVWTSSNTSVATVSAEGIVTGLTVGTTTITATSEENSEIKATCEITVEPITVKTWWGGPVALTIGGQEYYILYSFTRNLDKTITYTAIFDKDASSIGVKQVHVPYADENPWRNLILAADNRTASWTSATTHNKNEKIFGYFYFGGVGINFDAEETAYIVGSSNERPSTAVTSVTLDKTICNLLAGETIQLSATVNPGYADNKAITWASNAESVATVDANGLVTAKAEGTATITVTTADGGKTATCTINVSPLQARTWWGTGKVTINGHDVDIIYSITHNLDKTLTYTVIFGDDTDMVREVNARSVADIYHQLTGYDNVNKTASYTSTTTHSSGEIITGFFWLGGNGVDFTYIVGSVNERPSLTVESVVLNHTSYNLLINETVQLSATITPGTAANKSVTWSSNNNAVATVDENGLVTAKSSGSATITVTTIDGGKTATCTINVIASLTDATYYANAFFIENGRFVGFNYSITRTAERKLHYEATVNGNVVGLVVEINDGNWHGMVYDADSKSYSYTTDNTYADGITTSNHFFYVKFAGGAQEVDADYTVGSTNSPVRTMVGINDQEADQTTRLAQYTSPVDVVIARAFTDEYWQTITLPFTLNAAQITEIFGAGTQVLKLAKAGVAPDQAMELGFTTVTGIQASTPYLIMPAQTVGAGTIVRNVTLNTNAQTVKVSNVTMHPLLDKVTYNYTTDNVLFFVGSDNYLHYQANNNTILGLRAYFTFDGITTYAQAANVRARIALREDAATGLDNLINENAPVKVIESGQLIIIRDGVKYNIQGQKL